MSRIIVIFTTMFLMVEYFIQPDPNHSLLAMLVETVKYWYAVTP